MGTNNRPQTPRPELPFYPVAHAPTVEARYTDPEVEFAARSQALLDRLVPLIRVALAYMPERWPERRDLRRLLAEYDRMRQSTPEVPPNPDSMASWPPPPEAPDVAP